MKLSLFILLSAFSGSSILASAFSSPSDPNRRRSGPSTRRTRGSDESESSGPRSESSSQRRPRSDRQGVQVREIFDPKKLTSQQNVNEDANPLDLYSNVALQNNPLFIKRRSDSSVVQINSKADVMISEENVKPENKNDSVDEQCKGPDIQHSHIQYLSLDDLFPNLNFGKTFFTNGEFRQSIRTAMRKDVFFTTPSYANLSPKVAAMMLDDDSSLQGTWNCIPKNIPPEMKDSLPLRMTRLTKVLRDYLGSGAPTGDHFMITLGELCGENPSVHWIDIIGVKDRIVSHSWHQDTGSSYTGESYLEQSRYTVMLGFPIEDGFSGSGVFSHIIKLEHEHLAPEGHNENEPVLFEGTVDERYILRPEFTLGKEIIRYRDTDVLHSAPDVVYRQSVMRFM